MESRLVAAVKEIGSFISQEDAIKLIRRFPNMEEAVDYFLNHPELYRYKNQKEQMDVLPPAVIPPLEIKAAASSNNDLRKLASFPGASVASTKPAARESVAVPALPQKPISPMPQTTRDRIRQDLLAMGFCSEDAEFAASRTSSIEAAVNLVMSREAKMPANAPAASPKEAANLKTAEPSFDCPICFDSVPVSEMITLDCCHRFCKDCFVGHCTSKISSNEVQANELTCPTIVEGKPCGTPITVFELQAHLPAEVFEKYERFTLRGYCETEHLVACPSCNDWFVDIQAEDMQDERLWKCIRCQKCHHRFCAKCGNVPHKGQKDQDVTCEQYAAWLKANSKADEIFEKFMQEEKIFQCPSCGHAAERKEGCKFLYCRCKSNFCALCGVLLDKSQHYSHFQNAPGCTGPYGEVCRGVTDRTKEEPLK